MEHQAWAARDSRLAAYWRQGTLCALCWEPLGGPESRWEAHHRLRRRAMPEPFTWCPCDIVALHPTCHNQGPTSVHGHPEDARALGLIVQVGADPREVLVQIQWPWVGPAWLDCESTVVSTL